jgi:predicted heme/steroid binding protein
MTPEELKAFNGRDGNPAYIAVNGKVYDVTESSHWQNGVHPPDHYAGHDLTEELGQAPHVRSVVERFPVVGFLDDAQPESSKKAGSGKIVGILIFVIVLAVIAFILL